MLKVLLAYRCSDEGKSNPFERVLPVGVGYIHAWLRSAGIPAVLANFSSMTRTRARQILLAERPDVVGISCFTFNRSASIDLAKLVRRTLPRARVVLGGPHATHAGAAILREHAEVDVCVAGEGELTLERLVTTLSEGGDPRRVPGLMLRDGSRITSTGPSEPIADLDALPFPALYPEGYGVDPAAQYPYIVTSRGCPAKCTFCSSPEFWGSGVRFRSARNILDELQLLKERFGILYVSFRDDIFALNKTRVIDLCRGMIERRLCLLWDCQTRVNTIDEERLAWMKRAGALIVQYGVESGSQRILDRLRKGQRLDQIDRAAAMTRRAGLVLSVYLITGVPGETEEDLRATEAMLRRIRPHDGIVTPLAVFPGTELWDEYRGREEVDDGFWNRAGRDGVYVRPDEYTGKALVRLSALLDPARFENLYTPADFAGHREAVGECYVTDLMEGEHCERAGDATAAAQIYAHLAAREPWNPWPFLRLARLALEQGDPAAAERHLAAAGSLAPRSAEVRVLRARLARGRRAHVRDRRSFSRPAAVRRAARDDGAEHAGAERAVAAGATAGGAAPESSSAPDVSGGSTRPARAFQSYPLPHPLDRGDLPC